MATNREVATLRGHSDSLSSVAFSPDGRTLASGSNDKTARLWDVATGHEVAVLSGHEGQVCTVAFSPDGRTLATGSFDKTARLWDVSSRHEIAVLRAHTNRVLSVAFSPDGATLATSSADGSVRLWELLTRREISMLRPQENYVWCVAFSPDGRTLATASFPGVAFSPDGHSLATGSSYTSFRLWDASTKGEIAVVRGQSSDPNVPSTDTSSPNGTPRLWPVGQDLIDAACARVHGLPLSDVDKQRFGIENDWCNPEVSGHLQEKLASSKASR